jgi:hypothetical protein
LPLSSLMEIIAIALRTCLNHLALIPVGDDE